MRKCLSFLEKWAVLAVVCMVPVLIMIGFFLPSLSNALENSTKWVPNITPLVLIAIGYFLKDEIANWHYKKRSEAASEIIGKFRVCSEALVYYINARIQTPRKGEEAVEHKVFRSVGEYIKSCLEPSAEFPICIRKELDKHFEDMNRLASRLVAAITRDTDTNLAKTGGEELQKATNELSSIKSTLEGKQNRLDDLLGDYLNRH